MTLAEARRWARSVAADFIDTSWDSADWDEKLGPDGDRIDRAMKETAQRLRCWGPKKTDKVPRK